MGRGDNIRVEFMRFCKPGKRWWVVQESYVGPYSSEGAIPASKDFPNGSVYRTRKAAEAAMRRFLARRKP